MIAAANRRTLLAALFLLALGGLLLHHRVHPFLQADKEHPGLTVFRGAFLPATLVPLFDLVVVTALFATRRGAALGYLINGMLVIYGTVLMGHFSIESLAPRGLGVVDWVLRSTFPDIVLAWADFLIGRSLFESWMREA